MKKLLFMMFLLMTIVITACTPSQEAEAPETAVAEDERRTEEKDDKTDEESKTPDEAPKRPIKIGIMTGTEAQGGEEFYAAEALKEKYPDVVETAAYPDGAVDDVDALISETISLAETGVEAIVLVQAVKGTAAAIDAVRKTYPDMLFIVGAPFEDPDIISESADIVLNLDEVGMAAEIVEQAKKMNAKTFVHYTFARHMSYEALSQRRDALRDECEKNGMFFVDATAPDPLSEVGTEGARRFILEDVPKKIDNYGNETAFFSTDCALQEPLIRMVYQEGAIFPQQCHPSPFLGYPQALEIDIPDDMQGDIGYVIDKIHQKIDKGDEQRHFSIWSVPVNRMFIEGGFEYARAFLEGRITDRNDEAALRDVCNMVKGDSAPVSFKNYEKADGKTLNNYYLINSEYEEL